ncbi:hypothetical protein LWI28_024302 [Acer negundo]|uniref:Uncharacterized protein n=1 Tax=Acer negundo TaxID=4023 RepID=A0AAD5IVZ2_ACENE|nr:hypothetical protein LWI28_024302 [Acer negundo]
MTEKGFDYVVVLMSETIPGRVVLFEDSVDSWIHIACPRLFIDWGDEFVKPVRLPGWWETNSAVNSGCGCGNEDKT